MSTRFLIPMLAAAVALTGCAQTDESVPGTNEDAVEANDAGTESMAQTSDDEARRAAAEKSIEAGTAGEWTFGGDLGEGQAVTIAALNSQPEQYAGNVVKIEGTVASVCKHMGCWVEVAGAGGEKIMVASEDHDVLLPRNSEGKPITVEGRFQQSDPDEGGQATYSMMLDAASISASAR